MGANAPLFMAAWSLAPDGLEHINGRHAAQAQYHN